jgi:hypothetical protein
VYAPDGSDVRADYISLDVGRSEQLREMISVFVYRAPAELDREWEAVSARVQSQYPGSKAAQPMALPPAYPRDTRQLALVAPAKPNEQMGESHIQVTLFHEGPWAVRIELVCDTADLEVVQRKTRTFLKDIRVTE